MSSLSARPTPRTGRTNPTGLGGSRRNDARPEARVHAHASSARCSDRRHGRRRGRGGLGAPGELSVSEKVSLSAKLSVRRDGVPPSSSKDAVDDPASSATGAGVGACQACTNAAAAASCPGVCATGRIFAAAGVEPPITVTCFRAARASRTTACAAWRRLPRRTMAMVNTQPRCARRHTTPNPHTTDPSTANSPSQGPSRATYTSRTPGFAV
jgi:hypothetical protein